MIEANKAQIVMLAEEGILPRDQCVRIAAALEKAIPEYQRPGANRSDNYLHLERKLTEIIGPEASNLHLGRSRNDLGAVMNRMRLREETLDLLERIASLRTEILRIAGDHIETVVPGYTHAVQAQPTTLAHIFLAYDAVLQRDTDRIREAYARLNTSPLGAAAFTTSGFPLNRDRLAELLGFKGLVENSYDAISGAIVDSKVELVSAFGLSALNLGRFVQSLIIQYDAPIPGVMLTSDVTGRSSIMPQKRSPSILERLRLRCSNVLGEANTMILYGHNTPFYEIKDGREDAMERLFPAMAAIRLMYNTAIQVLRAVVVHPDVLEAHINRDYSTMTELADTLFREAGVPYRVGYKAASELTTYGRNHRKAPNELEWAEVQEVYASIGAGPIPLSEEQYRQVIDPLEFVKVRKGIGGPQPEETTRMLKKQSRQLDEEKTWTANEIERLTQAEQLLNTAFLQLASGN